MENDKPAKMMDLPTSIRGFCYHDDDGEEYIVLNARFTREANRKTYRHELKHIMRGDLDNVEYFEYWEESS